MRFLWVAFGGMFAEVSGFANREIGIYAGRLVFRKGFVTFCSFFRERVRRKVYICRLIYNCIEFNYVVHFTY